MKEWRSYLQQFSVKSLKKTSLPFLSPMRREALTFSLKSQERANYAKNAKI
jgi:hypothetical protein